MTQADKQALASATGALAVDMESHIAARLAAAHGLPFAALRVICDPAGRAIPPAAIAGMREDGGTDLGAILRALLRDPGQLPAMIRLAGDARTAFSFLARCRRALDADFMARRLFLDFYAFCVYPVCLGRYARSGIRPSIKRTWA